MFNPHSVVIVSVVRSSAGSEMLNRYCCMVALPQSPDEPRSYPLKIQIAVLNEDAIGLAAMARIALCWVA